jgi:peptide/nickel transport system substrate-binding protein
MVNMLERAKKGIPYMDWKRFDLLRRNSGAVELDLVESYAQKKINRRDFVKRGTIVGLSAPFMGAIIAACGGDDDDEGSTETTAGGGGGGTAGGELRVGIQAGDATSGLDPLNMLDLGTYCVLSQSFEYLVGLADGGGIGPTALASGWSPNDDASQWTFNLREGVTWQDGSPFTSADVAATLDRMAEVNAGVGDVWVAGSTETPDDLTVVMNLERPNGNLPALVSIYNPQSLITPVDYSSGTTLDDRTTGTGAWMLDSFDPTTFTSVFVPNPNWWGGSVNLDRITLQGFGSGGTKVAAMAAREIDVIQDFTVTDGGNLLTDDGLTKLRPPSANHRKIWFNTQLPEGGPFTDVRVRQAVGYAVDRQRIVDTVYQGEAMVANDHVVHPSFASFDDSMEQRQRNVELARQLLSDAGYPDGFETTLQVGQIGEVPQIAAIVEQSLTEVGITAPVGVTPNSDFYGEYWCAGASYGTQPETSGPGRPCGASAELGMVDYGHRPTPDVFFQRALATDGDWNAANYSSAEFDQLFTQFQSTPDVDGRRVITGQIQRLLAEDMPNCVHTFFQYLSGHDTSVTGVETTALGHLQFQNASKA